MVYPEPLIYPMRQDLAKLGVIETRTPDDVKKVLAENSTVLMVVNSVCGCAAGKARPAIGLALKYSNAKPDAAATVFAGADIEATNYVRELLAPMPPSSPSLAIFRDGKPVYIMHRHEIESRIAPEIAKALVEALEKHCTPVQQAS
jgi:putative YphP/YqiW family bacilliredoxin